MAKLLWTTRDGCFAIPWRSNVSDAQRKRRLEGSNRLVGPGGSRRFVVLHLTPLDAGVFFELALGSVESIAQSHVQIFVGLSVVMLTTDDNVFLWNVHVDPNMKEITLVLVAMLRRDRDFAADDVIAELLQLCRFFADLGLDSIGVWKATKCNL